jgi:guanylate kinase
MSGESFSWDQWLNYSQPQNNPMGATILAQMELDKRIAQKTNTESKLLDWGRGFLSPRDPATNKIKSPGSVVEEQINKRLGRTEDRLQMADEFDEIVSALVNQLVKIAVSEFRDSNR